MATNTIEDFSFPIVTNPLSNFMPSSSSSSLWRVSSRVFHHPEDEEEGEGEDDCRMEVRSMCEEILPSRREIQCKEFMELEERMDYLWQDFNEEEEILVRNKNKIANKQICVIQGAKLGRKQSSMLIIGKLLKGLVSIRKSAQLKISKARF